MSRKPLKVIAGTPDHPLVIGDIEIQCYVLEDETRVLSQAGFLHAIGRTGRPKTGHDEVFNIPVFLQPTNLKPFINKELISASQPVQFQAASGGSLATGYKATLLPEICTVYLEARAAGVLVASQKHIATRAEILIRGLATVGIIALVDEATGYQRLREEKALATILEKFIAKDLQSWTKTFPLEFYLQIAHLKDWPELYSIKRPSVVGHYTNNFVYDRLAPNILKELRQINPKLPKGGRRNRHHQWFTPEIGHPKLKEHLAAVTALMRAAPNWGAFKRNIQRAFPKVNETIPMRLEDD